MEGEIGVSNTLSVEVIRGIGLLDYVIFFGIISTIVFGISLTIYFAYKKYKSGKSNAIYLEPIMEEKINEEQKTI